VEKMVTAPDPPHFSLVEEIMPDGQVTFTTHYYGIYGPKGLNPLSGVNYEVETAGNLNDHGGFSQQGYFQRDPQGGSLNEKGHKIECPDGSSNTFLLGEMSWYNDRPAPLGGTRYRTWVRGCDNAPVCAGARNITNAINHFDKTVFNDMAMGSMHQPGGANFAMGDGSIRWVRENISLGTYRSMASRNGGESIGDN